MLSIPPALTVDPGELQAFDRAWIQEGIETGWQVRAFAVEARDVRGWQRIAEGTTIGYKRPLCFKEVTASRGHLAILDSRACPAISEFELFETSPRNGKFGRSRGGKCRREYGC
jgi:alpha-L-fucosidase